MEYERSSCGNITVHFCMQSYVYDFVLWMGTFGVLFGILGW